LEGNHRYLYQFNCPEQNVENKLFPRHYAILEKKNPRKTALFSLSTLAGTEAQPNRVSGKNNFP